MKNFRYVFDRRDWYPAAPTVRVAVIQKPRDIPPNLTPLVQALGPLKAARSALRILQRKRAIVLILVKGRVLCHAAVTFGYCADWPIERSAAVVGYVGTRPEARGRGLAVQALMQCLAVAFGRNATRVYIDTAESNLAMQRSIRKCGFRGPIFEYDADSASRRRHARRFAHTRPGH